MSLLPTTDDASRKQDGEIQVHGLNDEEMAEVFEALSSETARNILSAIHENPAPPAELSDRLELSLQNVTYHLDNLHETGLIKVADTHYSEKGKEMNVYGPADGPVVMFVGTEERKTRFLDLLKRLVGATGILVVASLLIFVTQYNFVGAGSGDSGGGPHPFVVFPGLEFLAGGLFLIGLIVLWWIWTR